ncbi:protein E6-like [Rhododendron vialii]|uniref:protein E6-like n=1 Tax=Rhododendron vialii TaxID=182163 RepID=UPI00265FACCA|nr:protein E6-like [Rhododendron vialii]
MAPSAKHFPFLLFFALLSSSLHSHARESYYFFNKATATPTNNNAKETIVEEAMPNKSNVREQDPNFIPDTQSGYGLYGQNSGGRHAAATNQPSEIESFEPYTTTASNNNNDNNYYKNEGEAYVSDPQGMVSDTRFMDGRYTTTTSSSNNNYYKNEAVNDPQGVSDKRFMDRSYTTTTATSGTPYTANNLPYKTESGESYPTTTINEDNNNYYNKEAYVSDPHEGMSHDTRFMDRGYTTTAATSSNNGGGRNYNPQQQGMSDTRFLENGRYYYDINSEENYRNGYQNSRRVNHNNRGYYGNYNGNSMEGYQNQDDQFQESEAEYVP